MFGGLSLLMHQLEHIEHIKKKIYNYDTLARTPFLKYKCYIFFIIEISIKFFLFLLKYIKNNKFTQNFWRQSVIIFGTVNTKNSFLSTSLTTNFLSSCFPKILFHTVPVCLLSSDLHPFFLLIIKIAPVPLRILLP